MDSSGISDNLKRFVWLYIDSVEQLEVLLFLRKHDEQTWNAKTISTQLRTNRASVAKRLAALERSGLLFASLSGDENSYQYRPQKPELVALVDELEHCNTERRFTLIELIFSKPKDHMLNFAEAFRFRKDD